MFRPFVSRELAADSLWVHLSFIDQILLTYMRIDEVTARHLETAQTISKIRQRYFWQGLYKQNYRIFIDLCRLSIIEEHASR